jgi:O-acetyl-ADP-ribose deacetylase (regulator of RNase III)
MLTLLKQVKAKSLVWSLKVGNIVDEPADVLICSANVSLNLSGGVGADLLGRFGTKMQNELHRMISSRIPRAAKRGEVFQYSGGELPYKAVLHAVAIDGWYQSTSEIVREVTKKAFGMAMDLNAKKVALTALATGYGNLSLEGFADGIRPLLNQDFPPINEVCICMLEDYRLEKLAAHLCRHPEPIS